MAEETRIGGAGRALATNIKRVRETQRLTYAELSRRLAKQGRHVPVLALQRIETMKRRVDFDDLLALAYVLEVCPVDLMVSNEAATDEPYSVVPNERFEPDSVRDWISGQTVVLHRPSIGPTPGGMRFGQPSAVMFDALKWMPKSRRADVLRTLSEATQWAINNPDDAEKQNQWLMEHEDELHEQWLAEQQQKGTES
jgi:hypothetical protein